MKNKDIKRKIKAGDFVKERYIKCPYTSKVCSWRIKDRERGGYNWLNDTCYLSGSFKLECPE